MERLKLVDKRIYLVFSGLFLAGIVFCMMPVTHYRPHHLHTFCYVILIILWGMTLNRRILVKEVRNRVLAACFLMILLFFLRMCKYSFFSTMPLLLEHIWLAYYIPMTGIPLFFFLASLRIEPVNEIKSVEKTEKILIVLWLLICIVIMTNSLHSQLFLVNVLPDKEFERKWFYFVILFWMCLGGMGSMVLMVKKCMLTAAKKYYYVPILCILAGLGLLIWYLIIGGSPKFFGYKLFQMQEAYCFPFITGLESALVIGLIPANSAYRMLFKHTGLHACIYSGDDRAILWSADWKEEDKKEAEKGEGDLRLRREEIAGGYICWIEDLTAIRKLNREIAEVTEELEDENELIRQENALRSERVGIETRNRLYNRIAKAVRPTALRVNELLEKEEPENIREDLIYAAFLSAYIKRMGNLILLTDGNEGTESGELALSVGESMEYLKLNGCACELMSVGSGRITSDLAILAYELFECVMEDVWPAIGCCAVELGFENGFYLMISTDVRAGAVTSAWKDRELRECGGRLSVRYEDETFYIRLEAGL